MITCPECGHDKIGFYINNRLFCYDCGYIFDEVNIDN